MRKDEIQTVSGEAEKGMRELHAKRIRSDREGAQGDAKKDAIELRK